MNLWWRVCAPCLAALVTAAGCAAGQPSGQARAARPATTATTGPGATVGKATTTSTTGTPATTTDPGRLPQTGQLPSASDPAFAARLADLVRAVASGDPAVARPAFFPLAAYLQVKAIADPEHDYDTRLIPDFDQDVRALHAELDPQAAPARLAYAEVPDTAVWVRPGVEYNKGSYWRVYGSTVHLEEGGRPHYFTVASMISWRGQWYVVHLSSIR